MVKGTDAAGAQPGFNSPQSSSETFSQLFHFLIYKMGIMMALYIFTYIIIMKRTGVNIYTKLLRRS